jgi:hypothetical protein
MILQKILLCNVDLRRTPDHILFSFNGLNKYRIFPILISVD